MNAATFVQHINALRKTNKDKWYTFVGEVDGKVVELKGYNLWLQIYRVDGIRYGGDYVDKVREFVFSLERPFY